MTSSGFSNFDQQRLCQVRSNFMISFILILFTACSVLQTGHAADFQTKYSLTLSSKTSVLTSIYFGSSRKRKVKLRSNTKTVQVKVPVSVCSITVAMRGGLHDFVASDQSCGVITSSQSVRCTSNIRGKVRLRNPGNLINTRNTWQPAVQLSRYGQSRNLLCSSAYYVKPKYKLIARNRCRLDLRRNGGWSNWTPQSCNPGQSQTRSCTNPPSDCGGTQCDGLAYRECPVSSTGVATQSSTTGTAYVTAVPNSVSTNSFTTTAVVMTTSISTTVTGASLSTSVVTTIAGTSAMTSATALPTTQLTTVAINGACSNDGCAVFDANQYCTSCQLYYVYNGSCCFSCPANCTACANTTICKGPCDDGFTLTSQYLCQDCPPSRNCDLCETESTCSHCFPGYYLTSSLVCTECSASCSNCLNETSCDMCDPGFQQDQNQQCFACPSNCMTCSTANKCSECVQSFYLTENGTCAACPTECLECGNMTYCTLCQSGNTKSSLNFYLDGNQCLPCGDHCIQCISGVECASTGCDVGYTTINGMLVNCTKCTDDKCRSCGEPTLCTQCFEPYYANSTSQCERCPDLRCKSCYYDSSQATVECFACDNGYQPAAGGVCVPDISTTASVITST